MLFNILIDAVIYTYDISYYNNLYTYGIIMQQ